MGLLHSITGGGDGKDSWHNVFKQGYEKVASLPVATVSDCDMWIVLKQKCCPQPTVSILHVAQQPVGQSGVACDYYEPQVIGGRWIWSFLLCSLGVHTVYLSCVCSCVFFSPPVIPLPTCYILFRSAAREWDGSEKGACCFCLWKHAVFVYYWWRKPGSSLYDRQTGFSLTAAKQKKFIRLHIRYDWYFPKQSQNMWMACLNNPIIIESGPQMFSYMNA